MLEHGGRLRQAAQDFKIPLDQWLDLSTGINPNGWLVRQLGPLPDDLWQRLPEDDDGLLDAARRYYGCRNILPVAGSQAAIRHLPRLLHQQHGPLTVISLQPIYNEHPAAWAAAGHIVESVDWQRFQEGFAGFAQADAHDDISNIAGPQTNGSPHVLLLCNPNNPTGHFLPADQILALARQLAAHGSWLVVDEAFADSRPELSVAAYAGTYAYPKLIVLRSLGKFFGLAGLRVGFVCAAPDILQALDDWLGPWTINNPARYIAIHALNDSVWQAMTQTRLQRQSERLAKLLTPIAATSAAGEKLLRSTDLFTWLQPSSPSYVVFNALAKQGILIRLFTETSSLRFGIPSNEEQWDRLALAITNLEKSCR